MNGNIEAIEVVAISGKDNILHILNQFSDTLFSLSRGADFRSDMAKKFSQNAVVLVLYDLYQRAAAFAAFYCNDSEKRIAYLSMIAVKAGYKRLGYGTALLNKVCEIAGHCGMQKLRLEVAKENATAIRFYQRAGFRQFMENSESLFLEISLDERVK